MLKYIPLCRVILAAPVLALVLGTGGCGKRPENPKPEILAPIKAGPGEVSAEAPRKGEEQPPNVKVKRDSEGNYTWEITGKDVDRIIRADRALRKSLGTGQVKQVD